MTSLPKTPLIPVAPLIALPLLIGGCEAELDEGLDDLQADDDAQDEQDDEQFRTWSPKSIDPALCNNPEQEPSRPPTGGWCEIELTLVHTKLNTGQGISEGRAELSAVVTATAPSGAQTIVNVPEQIYNAGQKQRQGDSLGIYKLKSGQTRNVSVCADFTEHDNGGANGVDDVGSACTNVLLTCDPNVGQPTETAIIGPTQLCGDNQCNGSASAKVEIMRVDADGDGIPNIEDFTPTPCAELNKGQEGVGLLLYYHYDDDAFTTLAQSLGTNLSKNFGAYDYVALVMDQATSNANNTSGQAFAQADMVYEPSREGILAAMRDLTAAGMRYDVKSHAHGYPNGPNDGEFEVLVGDRISGNWLENATDPNNIGTARGGVPIVAVWGTTCNQGRQIDSWETVGALTASGPWWVQFYPNAWLNYWDAWVAGMPYRTAVDGSVTTGVINAAEAVIAGQGAWAPFWCVAPDTVLGLNACAEDFFNDDVGLNEAQYNLEDMYDHNLSGADNMAISSTRSFVGQEMITFGGGAAVWP